MRSVASVPTPVLGRRSFLALAASLLAAPVAAQGAEARRYQIGFANLTEDLGTRLEGLGFTGADVRASFALAARALPVDMVFYDNDRNRAKTLANAEDAIARRLDLYIQYCDDAGANAEIAKRMKAAGTPVLAIAYPVPGSPLYGPDNTLAGRMAGEALAKFAASHWPAARAVAVIIGDLGNGGDHVPERVEGIAAALREGLPAAAQTRLDSNGNPALAESLLRRFAAGETTSKLLVAALDDTTALLTKAAVEDKKEIDPNNRGSIVIGSVAYLLDRYGYEVLPLALKMLRGDPLPPRTTTRHMLVTAANVFTVYPPIDMN